MHVATGEDATHASFSTAALQEATDANSNSASFDLFLKSLTECRSTTHQVQKTQHVA
jgi:hypothetical protein